MSSTRRAIGALLLVGSFSGLFSQAHAVSVKNRLDGYVCIGIIVPGANDPRALVQLPPVYAAPSPSSAKVGVGSSVMIAASPITPTDGFVGVLLGNGKRGWVEATLIERWHAAMSPNARCYPALMSDGSYAFDYETVRH